MIEETEFETCSQWIDREINRARKQQEQIERLQNHPSITARLFNESRDCCDQIHSYIERLRFFRVALAANKKKFQIIFIEQEQTY